jgi:hypothetical protein
MAAEFVTTLDNPFDYFTQFDEWYAFDTQKGYNTCAYIARIALTSSEMSEKDYEQAVKDAVDDILRLNITGNYKRVVENGEETETEKELKKETTINIENIDEL